VKVLFRHEIFLELFNKNVEKFGKRCNGERCNSGEKKLYCPSFNSIAGPTFLPANLNGGPVGQLRIEFIKERDA